MEHTAKTPGAVSMDIDDEPTVTLLPSTHLEIEVDDLGCIDTGPGSQGSVCVVPTPSPLRHHPRFLPPTPLQQPQPLSQFRY